MLTLPHPHVQGVAHRMNNFERTLHLLIARPDTIFLTGSQIARWFVGLGIDEPAVGT